MRFLRYLIIGGTLLTLPHTALALEARAVVASIKPIHSLVSAVMRGVGEPKLIVQGAGSEHDYSLKPSDAEAFEQAKLVFWVGPEMEVFLRQPLEALAEGAKVVTLAQTDGLRLLKMREGGDFEPHHHGDEDEEHEHGADAAHEDHTHHHHDSEYDMHIWLDPQNAKMMIEDIAKELSGVDPDNAQLYRDNAIKAIDDLDELQQQIVSDLLVVKGKPFIVFHDAYQYFETSFGLMASGSIVVSPERAPGAARIRAIHDKIKGLDAVCVFSEPQFESRLVHTVIEGTDARTGELDPLGAHLKDGPQLYPQLIRNLADSLRGCLQE